MSDNVNFIFIIISIFMISIFFMMFRKKSRCKKERNCESGHEIRYCKKCKEYTCHEHYQTPPESGDYDDPSNKCTNHYICKCCGNAHCFKH